MEQKIFSKFNLYDQIGYLMVGAIAVLIIVFDAVYFFQASPPSFTLDMFVIWLVIVYFAGHLVQGLSNLINKMPLLKNLIRENKKGFTEEEKEILNKAKEYFKIEKQDDDKLWNICYMLATAKDITGQVQAFNAYYSLYRGWLVVFILQSLFLIYTLVTYFCWPKLVLLFISLFLCYIFYSRSKRFWKYTRRKALETFLIVKTLEL